MTNQDTNSFDNLRGEMENSDNESQAAITNSCKNQQKAFERAAEGIICGGSACSGDSSPFGGEIRNLEEWARSQTVLIPDEGIESLDLISNTTSEHQVFFRKSDSRAVKRTLAGVYGQIPVPENGYLGRRNAFPSEYFKRMSLQLAVFGGDIRLEGVTISDKPSFIIGEPVGQPSVVISQRWYEKSGVATTEAIDDFLVQEGFRPVAASYYGWYRPVDRVVIVDAKPDNFIQTSAGLVPIDLQMVQFDEEQMIQAGLVNAQDDPVIYIPRN